MTDDPRAAALETLARKIADDLFVNGGGDQAERLVLAVDGPPALNLGGWSKPAVISRIVAALLKAAPPAEGPKCEWFSDSEDDSMLTTACGQEFYRLEDSAPTLAWMKFCCYCGKRVSLPTPPRDPAGKE